MPYARLLNFRNHYSNDHGRFKSYAFQDSEDGSGISVISLECARCKSGGLCEHAARLYRTIAGTPIIFWPIPESLQAGWNIAQDREDGDDCHHLIKGISEKEGGKLAKQLKPEHLIICDETGPRQMTVEDVSRLVVLFGMK